MRLLRSLVTGLGLLALLLAAAVVVLPARSANACWDGVYADTGRMRLLQADDAPWSPERVRHVARWVARIEALLPARSSLSVEHGQVELCGAEGSEDFGCVEPDDGWRGGDLEALFTLVADLVDADEGQRARARSLNGQALTVQVAVSRYADRAAAFADELQQRLGDEPLFGFVEVGGFPADNRFAHVIDVSTGASAPRHRVVVGAFLDAAEARAAARRVREVTGHRAFVRPL